MSAFNSRRFTISCLRGVDACNLPPGMTTRAQCLDYFSKAMKLFPSHRRASAAACACRTFPRAFPAKYCVAASLVKSLCVRLCCRARAASALACAIAMRACFS
eukprot:2342677-Pleurochrysis_carterae.AAC.3